MRVPMWRCVSIWLWIILGLRWSVVPTKTVLVDSKRWIQSATGCSPWEELRIMHLTSCCQPVGPDRLHKLHETTLVDCIVICSIPNLHPRILQTPCNFSYLLILSYILHQEVHVTAIFEVCKELRCEFSSGYNGRFPIFTRVTACCFRGEEGGFGSLGHVEKLVVCGDTVVGRIRIRVGNGNGNGKETW